MENKLRLPLWLRMVVVSLLYLGGAAIGQTFSVRPSAFATFWPPSGILVAALLLSETRQWPWLLLAALPANIAFDLLNGRMLWVSLCFSLGNLLEALAGAWLARHFVARRPTLSSWRETLATLGFCASISPILSATIGTSVVVWGLGQGSWGETWRVWWGADMLGVLLFAPPLLSAATVDWRALRRLSWRRLAEIVAVTVLLILGTWVTSSGYVGLWVPYWMLPLLLYIAFRFGPLGASWGGILFVLIAIWGAMSSQGMLSLPQAPPPLTQALVVQTFFGFLQLMLIALAALFAEQQRAAHTLQSHAERLRAMVDHLPIGAVLVERENIRINRAAEEITGYTRDELTTWGAWFKALCGAQAESVRAMYEADRQAGFPVPREVSFTRKDGQERIAQCTSYMDAESEIQLFRDVTEHNRADAQLRESEERYRSTFDAASDALFVADAATGMLLDANRHAQELSGYALAELRAMHQSQLHPPDLRESAERDFDSHVTNPGARLFRQLLLCRDGTSIPVEISASAMTGWGNRLVILGTFRDLRERMQAEARVAASESQFRRLVETASEGIVMLDGQFCIVFANRQMGEMFGLPAEELAGGFLRNFMFPEDLPDGEEKKAQRRAGEAPRYERRFRRHDGSTLWTIISAAPVMEEGQMQGVLCTIIDITARKQAEEALRQERDRARLYLDTVGVIVVAVGADERVTLINKWGCQVLGYEDEGEVVGRNWFDCFLPEGVRESVREVFARLMASDIAPLEWFENTILTKSGAERIILWHNTILCDEEEHITGTLSSGEDITERRRAEGALRKSEEDYRRIVETVNEGIWVIGADFTIRLANRRMAEMLGYDVEELVGHCTHDFMFPEDVPLGRKMMEARRQGISSHYERRFIRQDGSTLWTLVSATPILEQGEFAAALAIVTDITERKRAEEALQESEERYRSIVETINEGLWSVDSDFRTTFVNPQMAAMLGYTVEELLGTDPRDFTLAEDLPTVEAQRDLRRSGVASSYERRLRRRDGEVVWTLISATPLLVAGKFAGTLTSVTDITARKQAEGALRESEARYRGLFERMPVGLYRTTLQGQILDANPVLVRMLGFPDRATLLAVNSHSFYVQPAQRAETARLSTTAEVTQEEVCFRRYDGSLIWVCDTSRAIRDERGEISVYEGSLEDITARKQAEEALRRSEEDYRRIVETVNEGIWVLDGDFHISFANHQITAMFGYPVEEMLGHYTTDFLFPEGVAESIASREARRRGQSSRHERRFRRKDGSDLWVIVSARPIMDGERFVGSIASVTDITERKLAEEALRRSEESFRTLVTNVPGLVYRCELAAPWRTSMISEGVEAITGYAASAFTQDNGLTWGDIVLPQDMSLVSKVSSDGIAERRIYEIEYRIRHASGELRWVYERGRALYDAAGAPLYLDGVIMDITTSKLLEEQLLQAQKMEAVGRLAGGVAHDFNNLLTVINGYSEMLLSGLEGDNPLRADLEQIERAGQRAAALTHQLLAFSRRQMLQPRVLNLNELLTGLGKMLSRLIGEDIRLEFNLLPELGSIMADPGQIEQVVMNLAVNARDAMPDGGTLSLQTSHVTLPAPTHEAATNMPAGLYVLLNVTDTGSGMSPEVQAHLFEPFFTTKGVGKGTGLGLATIYGIVKQSGGEIQVHSVEGQGTTFGIYLPRLAEAPTEARVAAAPPPVGQETILVVEDQVDVRQIAVRQLRQLGYTVLEAPDPLAALTMLGEATRHLDLLLTDMVMPEMNGKELAEKARQQRPTLSVLFMTGYTDEMVTRQGLSGREPFLQKPFTPAALAQAVRGVLDKGRG
jgi:PAS domain S-box-containing protein